MCKGCILVTGGATGIGKSVVEALANSGYAVAFSYHSSKNAALELENKLLGKRLSAKAIYCDITSSQDVKSFVETARNCFGSIYGLINNAGISSQKLFDQVAFDEWLKIFDVNVNGSYHLIQEVLPDMIHAKCGRIVNMSSVWGIVGASCEVAYSSSKAAIIGMTKALAKELAPSGITVNCVAPGAVDTAMMHQLGEETVELVKDEILMGRLATPQDIAHAVSFFVSPDSSYITGQVLSVAGGYAL